MKNPKISVIVPVFNVQDYLEECLESLKNQTFQDYEVIAVNDGSNDNSLQILNEFAETFSKLKIISQINRGLSSARNLGLKMAKGDFVFFLDSDDILDKITLEICYKKSIEADLEVLKIDINSFEKRINAFPKTSLATSFDIIEGKDLLANLIQGRNTRWMMAQTFFIKRDYLLKTKVLFKEGLIHEDVLFTPQVLFFAERTSYLKSPLYHYRIREGSITNSDKTLKSIDSHFIVCKDLLEFANYHQNSIFMELVYKRFYILMNLIDENKQSVPSLKKYWKEVVSVINKNKLLKQIFITNKTVSILYLHYKPITYSISNRIQIIFSPFRRFFKYHISSNSFINA